MWLEFHDHFRGPESRRATRLLILAEDGRTPLALAIQIDNRVRFCLSTDSDFVQQLSDSGLMQTDTLIPEVRKVP